MHIHGPLWILAGQFWCLPIPTLYRATHFKPVHSTSNSHSPKRAECRCPTLASMYGRHAATYSHSAKFLTFQYFPMPTKLSQTNQQHTQPSSSCRGKFRRFFGSALERTVFEKNGFEGIRERPLSFVLIIRRTNGIATRYRVKLNNPHQLSSFDGPISVICQWLLALNFIVRSFPGFSEKTVLTFKQRKKQIDHKTHVCLASTASAED